MKENQAPAVVVYFLHARHDLEQRRLPRAVRVNHADLRAGREGKLDVFQHRIAAGIGLRQLLHGVDILRRGHGGVLLSGVWRGSLE